MKERTRQVIKDHGGLINSDGSIVFKNEYQFEQTASMLHRREVSAELEQAKAVCSEAYQVIGSLLVDLDQFMTQRAKKILDNLLEARKVHTDVLPWPSFTRDVVEQEKPQKRKTQTPGNGDLTVWFGPMPESNGRTNWTAILHRGNIEAGFNIDRGEYPEIVRYSADRVRWIIGELDEAPNILEYNGDLKTPCHLCGGSGKKDGKPCWGLKFQGTVHDVLEEEPAEEDWEMVYPLQSTDLRDKGPLNPGWETYLGTGPEGFGFYAYRPEDFGKGAVCLATFDPAEYPEAVPVPEKMSERRSPGTSTPMSTGNIPVQWTWKGSLKPQIEEGVAQFVIEKQDFSIPLLNFKSAQRIATMLDLAMSSAKQETLRGLRDHINNRLLHPKD